MSQPLARYHYERDAQSPVDTNSTWGFKYSKMQALSQTKEITIPGGEGGDMVISGFQAPQVILMGRQVWELLQFPFSLNPLP